ncbi:uncharacterized protein LOC112082812 [Eutrema salsugineum]|uniref:uncharacterized protein LOC112082812 n=1 Tax=Eutrema salsugineum TaxID=72664 RepID=UPI000CED2465|nr:uncharacterized protein LOC112082812 [Eutrema salsugineum]
MGTLLPQIGVRGFVDMGIPKESTVEDVILNHRRRRHRLAILNMVEDEIDFVRRRYLVGKDDDLSWRTGATGYKSSFRTSSTVEQLRHKSPIVRWAKSLWFKHNSPKYSFIAWLAMHNRLAMDVRMQAWNANISSACIFCNDPMETREHLFFSCRFSIKVWTNLAKGILLRNFTADWSTIINLISESHQQSVKWFLIRYLFQTVLYTLWREQNDRRHGGILTSAARLIVVIDKSIWNRFSSIRNLGDHRYDDGLQLWFSTRPSI